METYQVVVRETRHVTYEVEAASVRDAKERYCYVGRKIDSEVDLIEIQEVSEVSS